MSDFRLYNTLSREVEPFAPADGETVLMYSCGPTVYNPAHLGNFRTFLFVDLLRRVIGLRGWSIRQVMNLTDVDDKIIRRADEQGRRIGEITEPVTAIFHADREYLRIQPAEEYPKATDFIPQMIALVEKLVARGVAYQAEDGSIYFAISRFDGYGKLSRLDTREIRAGARVSQDDYSKENAQDFALWKAARPEDERAGAAWDSPWGRGRPGWHLECSAMALELLGDTLDIHCGGIDLVFPHHEDEIAQSEAATGKTFARCWCHGAFLLVEGAKMAKRIGNVSTVKDMRESRIPAAAVRHFVFNTHYRKELNLSEEALEGSIQAVRRVGDFADRLAAARRGTAALAAAAHELVAETDAALFDDLNAPAAMGALFTFINRANAELDRAAGAGDDAPRAGSAGGALEGEAVPGDRLVESSDALEAARAAFARVMGVLDILPDRDSGDPELAVWVEERLAARAAARSRRDFAEADRIRAELGERGVVLEDTGGGTKWKVVR